MRPVKRTEIMAFLDITPKGNSESFKLVGNGMTSGSYSYEAGKDQETYIVNDNATTIINNYSIAIDGEMKCFYGDAVYDYINELRYKLATGEDAETTILLVDKYDFTTVENVKNFKAQKFNCAISISSYGGDGGVTPTIGFTVDISGDPTNGTVVMNDGVPTFTETVEA